MIEHDPFADINNVDQQEERIYVRIRQRTRRKPVTSIEGLNPKFDYRRGLKLLKKTFSCNAALTDDPDIGKIIHLAGDQRSMIVQYLYKINDKYFGYDTDRQRLSLIPCVVGYGRPVLVLVEKEIRFEKCFPKFHESTSHSMLYDITIITLD